jgi:hypothetical protein
MTMAKPRWKSRIRWDDTDRATHNGRAYELWTHSYDTGKNGWSGTDDYHVHEIPAGGAHADPRPLYGPLGTSRRHAVRLAELRILGWIPAPGTRSPEHGYREMWRSPDGTLHPLEDVLSGAVPH